MGRDRRGGDKKQEELRRYTHNSAAEAKRLQRAERRRAQAAAEASAREEDDSPIWELKYCFQDPVGTISIAEDWSGEGNPIAGLQWLGGVVLRQVFPEEYFVRRRIIEVGAGCGLTSIYLAMRGAQVTITDMDIDKCIENVESNLGPRGLMSLACVQRLEWASEEDLGACEPPYDMVIAGDCLYEEACIVPLLETMWALAGPETEVLLCGVVGHGILERFLLQVDSYFLRQTVDTSLVDTLTGEHGAHSRGNPGALSRDHDGAGVVPSGTTPHGVAVGQRGEEDTVDPEETRYKSADAGAGQRPGQRALLRLRKRPVVATDGGVRSMEGLLERKGGDEDGLVGEASVLEPTVSACPA